MQTKSVEKPGLWKRFKQLLIRWLEEKDVGNPSIDSVETPISRNPGLDCPQCSYRIPITIPMLLSDAPIVCTSCGLIITVDKEKSRNSLNELKKLDTTINKAQEILNENQKNL